MRSNYGNNQIHSCWQPRKNAFLKRRLFCFGPPVKKQVAFFLTTNTNKKPKAFIKKKVNNSFPPWIRATFGWPLYSRKIKHHRKCWMETATRTDTHAGLCHLSYWNNEFITMPTTVSKTGGWGFEPLHSCHFKRPLGKYPRAFWQAWCWAKH